MRAQIIEDNPIMAFVVGDRVKAPTGILWAHGSIVRIEHNVAIVRFDDDLMELGWRLERLEFEADAPPLPDDYFD